MNICSDKLEDVPTSMIIAVAVVPTTLTAVLYAGSGPFSAVALG